MALDCLNAAVSGVMHSVLRSRIVRTQNEPKAGEERNQLVDFCNTCSTCWSGPSLPASWLAPLTSACNSCIQTFIAGSVALIWLAIFEQKEKKRNLTSKHN